MKKMIASLLVVSLLIVFPASAAGGDQGTAYASTQTVLIDGVPTEFQAYALRDANGYDTNYIKLRDVALLLNGTASQFQVSWDGAVNILPGQRYTPNGSELSTPFSGDHHYERGTSDTKINGVVTSLDAIMLKDNAGGAYTYYQLRDLGKALGFAVDWSAETGITISTTATNDTPQTADPEAGSAKNIAHEGILTEDGKILLIMTNSNSVSIPDFEVDVVFYDAEGKMLGTDSDGHDAVLPGATVVSIMDLPSNSEGLASYEPTFAVDWDMRLYDNLSEQVKVESNSTKDSVIVKATNNSEKVIEELEMVCVFYNGEYVVGAKQEEKYDIAPGATAILEFSSPFGSGLERLPFDDYSLFINQAHNFGL